MTERWIRKHTSPLDGTLVAVTGTTGGLGRELCGRLAALGASLLLLDRNSERSAAFRQELLSNFPTANVRCIRLDLEDSASVFSAAEILEKEPIDVFVHNAGAYSIPRNITDAGYDNVFQINYVSPYYLIRRLLPRLRARNGRVIVVGSIAHRYSRTDPADLDFSKRKRASLVYGNAKRHLMFSMYELFAREGTVHLAVTHPGICFTNITAHYPKVVFALIKHPMKLLFMKPKKAALSILAGAFDSCRRDEWIGPSCLDIWGLPKKKALPPLSEEERREIAAAAEAVYERMECLHHGERLPNR